MSGSRPEPTSAQGRIVVGVDGSASSIAALRWAADVARCSGRAVSVVHAWLPALRPRVDPALEREAAEATAVRMVETVIAEAVGARHPGLHVTTTVTQGDPVTVLAEAARDADLLVVGNRRHSEVGGVLLGSVAMRVASHLPTPVAVVPPLDRTDAGGPTATTAASSLS